MRRTIGFVICVVMIAVACNKTTTPTITAEEQLEKDINLIDQYLADSGINAIKLESGVRYIIDQMGEGPTPTKDNCLRFRYAGYMLYDTAAFDSNHEDGLKSPLKHLVAGMQIGLKQMPVGTKGRIFMPSVYGYGVNGSYDSYNAKYIVNPSTPIWFDVEVVQLYAYNTLGNYCYE